MSTSSLIPNIKVDGISSKRAVAFKALGVVVGVHQRPISNGYVQVEIHLKYQNPASGREDTFYARWNVRPEWFTPEYMSQVELTRDNKEKGLTGPLGDNELIQYDINMSGLTKSLFKAGKVDEIDLDENTTQIIGKVVGFKTKQQKQDPSRLDVSYFFIPKAQ
jgi:hypothetical protein